ncbi:MAG: SDR family NAD(P)-dependent oxidoreductase [Pseudomonadota bacterium]
MKLDGHTAIVTGGASGLGEATSRLFTESGMKVAIWDMKEKEGEDLAKELGGVFCKTDVSSEENVNASLDKTAEAVGTARVLINCAGVPFSSKTFSKKYGPHPAAAFTAVFNVNLLGTFNCVRLFAQRAAELDVLDDGERGAIVNTASVAAIEGQMGQVAYTASKAGVMGMTIPISRDLAEYGIRCNTIAPGVFGTPMGNMMPDKVRDSLISAMPFPKRFGNPSEYASLALELVSNTMMNGETIRIDGGIRMQPK